MSDAIIMVRYFGKWEKTGINYLYEGGKSKGVIVKNDISYEALLDIMYGVTKIERLTHEIQMKYVVNAQGPMEPVHIEDDNDVNCFLRFNNDRSLPVICLCISFSKRRCVDDNGFNFTSRDDDDDFMSTDVLDSDFQGIGLSRNNDIDNDLPNPNFEETHIDDVDDDPVVHVEANADDGDPPVHVEANATFNLGFNVRGNASSSSIDNSQILSNRDFVNASDDSLETLVVGELFVNKKSLLKKVSMYALELHFQFKVERSTKCLFVVRCLVSDCKWWLRATRVKDTDFFVIKVFRDSHISSSCFTHDSHRQASSWVVGQCIKSKYEGVGCIYRPKDIVQDWQRLYGVSINYGKAWRARKSAMDSVRGSSEASYARRPKKQRILSAGETRPLRICSRCKKSGHNSQTCTEPISLGTTSSAP